jgi:hypothetical protein
MSAPTVKARRVRPEVLSLKSTNERTRDALIPGELPLQRIDQPAPVTQSMGWNSDGIRPELRFGNSPEKIVNRVGVADDLAPGGL